MVLRNRKEVRENLRLAGLGGSSRVTGCHGVGGDGECPAGGWTGELGDGLAEHLVYLCLYVRLGG